MSLINKTVKNSYKDILQIENSNAGVDGAIRTVMSGNGNNSSLGVSENSARVTPKNDSTSVFKVTKKGGATTLFNIDSTNDKAEALGNQLNTNIKEFAMGSGSQEPSVANTWTALMSNGAGRASTYLELGTGATPDTSYTITASADDVVQAIFYVPVNISIDSCHVWAGADTATGDTFKYSVMAYDIDTSNGSTGGDLSNGIEHCVSPSAVAGLGDEQAYYQSLLVSNADVDSGKAIVAFVHQDGINSDLSILMQLIYHLR